MSATELVGPGPRPPGMIGGSSRRDRRALRAVPSGGIFAWGLSRLSGLAMSLGTSPMERTLGEERRNRARIAPRLPIRRLAAREAGRFCARARGWGTDEELRADRPRRAAPDDRDAEKRQRVFQVERAGGAAGDLSAVTT